MHLHARSGPILYCDPLALVPTGFQSNWSSKKNKIKGFSIETETPQPINIKSKFAWASYDLFALSSRFRSASLRFWETVWVVITTERLWLRVQRNACHLSASCTRGSTAARLTVGVHQHVLISLQHRDQRCKFLWVRQVIVCDRTVFCPFRVFVNWQRS